MYNNFTTIQIIGKKMSINIFYSEHTYVYIMTRKKFKTKDNLSDFNAKIKKKQIKKTN